MDVNQTRFHLVYGKAEWYPQAAAAVSPPQEPLLDWNEQDATLTLHQELFIFPRPAGQAPLTEEGRRGAGRDRYGNWYWIGDGKNDLRFLANTSRTSEHFWSAADRACAHGDHSSSGSFTVAGPEQAGTELVMSALAVTTDHFLVVGMTSPKGLLLFDLHGGGPPLEYLWPAGVPFAPFDIAPAADGGVWILDRDNKAYWNLDRYFRVRTRVDVGSAAFSRQAFVPVNGKLQQEQVQCFSHAITADFAMSLASLADPVAIEGLPDGSVLILDNPPAGFFSVIYQYRFTTQIAPPLKLDHALARFVPVDSLIPHADALRGYDMAFVPEGGAGTLYVAGIDGEQVFAFALKDQPNPAWLEVQPRYLPMRRFGGKAIVAGAGSVYYDFDERWWLLVEQPMARYKAEAALLLPQEQANANADSDDPAFDGKELGCTWHRLALDACMPPGTEVHVESRTADLKPLLQAAPWQPEPDPYLRNDGPEIPFYRSPLTGPRDRVGTWELLFQSAHGRYLQLRLTLKGTGRNTPRLHALRVWYPRFSYLRQYLPAVYRDDAISASFLDRYLANIEGFYTSLEGKIEQVQTLFDPRTVPAEYLDWLASWVGLTLDLKWSEETRRMVLSHAPQMFSQRGTLQGMVRAIRLGLDPCPDEALFQDSGCAPKCPQARSQSPFMVRVVERFLTRNAPGVLFGDPTDVLGPGATTSLSAWTPAQGPGQLHTLFRDYLRGAYGSIANLNSAWETDYSGFDDGRLQLPAVQPSQKTQAADWQRFLRGWLGFTYAAVSEDDLDPYRDFLQRKYPLPSDLKAAYNLDDFYSFDQVQLPDTLPAAGLKLRDWIEFVSIVLPRARNAHRFTVLVPVTLRDDPDTQMIKLSTAQRIAELEKPAHTIFDTRLYWGMFRVGEARVGLDTFLGQGTRSVALVLGRDYLAGGHLGFVEPWNVSDRTTIATGNAAQPCCGQRPRERCT